MAFTGKSVVFDFANNYGDSNYMRIRSIEFYYQGSKITLTTSNSNFYATTEYNSNLVADHAFESLGQTGSSEGTEWSSNYQAVTNQRLIVVFDSEQTFDSIVVNNAHEYGSEISRGVKDLKITITSDSYINTTYNAVISGTPLTIFDGTVSAHIASNISDDQELALFENFIIHSLPALEFAGKGWLGNTILWPTFPVPIIEISGDVDKFGLRPTLPALEISMSGTCYPTTAAIAFSLPALSCEIQGTTNRIDISFELPALQAQLHRGGHIEFAFPKLAAVLAGDRAVSGDIAVEFPALQASLTSGGYIDAELPGVSCVIQATKNHVGKIEFPFPSLDFFIESSRPCNISIVEELPALAVDISALPGHLSKIQATLPALKVSISAFKNITADISYFLPSLQCSMTGKANIAGSIEIEFPALDIVLISANFESAVLKYVRGKIR
jgi:hypothetical protein